MKHLGIIMDGNGRWAQERSLPRTAGHEKGAISLCKLLDDFVSLDVDVLTVYAFSTENEKRSKEEVGNILGVIAYFLSHQIKEIADKNSLKIRFIGNLSRLPEELNAIISELNASTINNDGKTVVFAIGYGGIDEVTGAIDRIMKRRAFLDDYSPVTEEELYNNLYTAGLPMPDAILRYGGSKRLSNFLPLQSIYSELFFTNKYWPDYDKEDIEKVIKDFDAIKRNFGGNDA